MIDLYHENDRDKILLEVFSPKGYIRKGNTLFKADEIQVFLKDYLKTKGHLVQPPDDLSKRINRFLVYNLRSTDFTQLSQEKLHSMGIERDDIDMYFSGGDIGYEVNLELEQIPFFKAIQDSVIEDVFLSPSLDSPITKAFIDCLENANYDPQCVDLTRLPTALNLDVAFSKMCSTPDFNCNHLSFSREVLREYINQSARDIMYVESEGLKRNLLKYASHVLKNNINDSLIDENSWDMLLGGLKLSGVVELKDGQFTIDPQAPSLSSASDELTRRKYLSQMNPGQYKKYLESGDRKEEDKKLNEQIKSSEEEVSEVKNMLDRQIRLDEREMSEGVKAMFYNLSSTIAALDAKKLQEIDALFLDSKYGLITGIAFGNFKDSANVIGVIKEILKKSNTFDKSSTMTTKLLLPVIEHTLKILQSDEVSVEDKATLLSRLAQGLGDCNTPFIDAFINETLVLSPETRKLDNSELSQLLENRALQKHFQQLIAAEVKEIDNSTEPGSIERETRTNAVNLPADQIENVAASVVIARGQFYFHQHNIPRLIRGLEPSSFITTRNLEFAVSQLKSRQLELLLPTICKTKLEEGRQVLVGKEATSRNGTKVVVYEVDPVKFANITRKEKRVLTMASGIDVLGIAEKMSDHVAKVCSQDENILDFFDNNEDNLDFECPAIFNPNTQQQEFALRLEDQIAMGNVTPSNVMEFLESEKRVMTERLKTEGRRLVNSIAQDTTQEPQQNSSVLGRGQQGDLAGLSSTTMRRTESSDSLSSQSSSTSRSRSRVRATHRP